MHRLAPHAAWLIFSVSSLALSTLASPAPIHPVVDAQTGYLLGGSKNHKWIDANQTASALPAAQRYSVFGNSKQLGDTTGSRPRTGLDPCVETQWMTLGRNYNGVLATGAPWNVIPRVPRPQNLQQKVYRDEVALILKSRGIRNSRINITQLWRVDLEGDGREEVLLSATNYAAPPGGPMQISPNANAGEYSFALMRKVVNGKVQTVMLAQEFYPQAKTFNAPSVYSLGGVYDLNGDGKLEILLRSRYYEGDYVSVLEVNGGAVQEVLSAGCGA